MFNFKTARQRKYELQSRIVQLEIARNLTIDDNAHEREELQMKLSGLRTELDDLKRQKKHESEDIAHLVKIQESKLNIEFAEKTVELERAQQEAIAVVKDEFRDKLEAQLKVETTRILEMHGQILARLPNINVKLGGNISA